MARRIRKRRQTFNEPRHAHFLTFSCYRRLPVLSKDRSRQWFVDALDAARSKLEFDIWAYVVMPEHAHLLIWPRREKCRMEHILAAIKRPVSVKAKRHLQDTGNQTWLDRLTVAEGDETVFRFWQAGGGHDENLWNERPVENVIDCIHANQVRRGLVARPTDWHWSSARWHAGMRDGPLTVDQVRC
jgi:putative transposase